MRWAAPIDTNWLTSIDRGEWQSLADTLGAGGREPQFYELTIDPFKPLPDPADPKGDVSPAAHLFYFIKDTNKNLGRDASLSETRPVPANAVASVARSLLSFSQKSRTQKDGASSPFIGLKDGSPEPDVTAAIEKILKSAGWSADEVDLWEVNEAFACVAMFAMRDIGIPHDKINVNGGGTALGHPVGASGTRIIVTLLNALKQQGKKRGVASLCIGGGEATAVAVELV